MYISDDQQRAKILYTLAFVLVQVGKVAQAHAVAESIVDVRHRDQAFRKVVAGLVQIGHIGQAQVVAESIFDENQRVDAIGSVAQALAKVDTVSQRNVQDTIQTSTAMDIELVYQDDCSAMKRSISGLWRSAATRSGLLEMVQLAEGYLIGDPDLCQTMVASFAWVDAQLREG